MKDMYFNDIDLDKVYKAYENLTFNHFYRFDGYLFKEKIYYMCSLFYT